MKGLLGLSLLLPLSFGYFTPHFREYLVTTYGNDTAKELERGDLGEEGSYGGKANSTQALRHKPAVLVHGIGTNAQKWVPLKNYFMKNGYTDAEIYGTTWGDPDENIIFVSVQCTYVRQVRTLIEAAHNYTKWKVDIAGFSLGSVIARKAILGGYCQGEDLGGPLTDIFRPSHGKPSHYAWDDIVVIDTFVSVAGPNRGSAMCEQFTNIDLCNTDNGLACDSSLLYELNNVGHRYEGKFSFAVHSQKDEKIGNWCCGERCGSLPHSQREFGNHQEHHNLLLLRSTRLIYDLFWVHKARPPGKKANATTTAAPTNSTIISSTIIESNSTITSNSTSPTSKDYGIFDGFNLSAHFVQFTISGCMVFSAWIIFVGIVFALVRQAS